MTEIDLRPINLGFDLKQIKLPVFFCGSVTKATFINCDNERVTVEGTNIEVREALEDEGFTLFFETLPFNCKDD
jgi:hypothetical protein